MIGTFERDECTFESSGSSEPAPLEADELKLSIDALSRVHPVDEVQDVLVQTSETAELTGGAPRGVNFVVATWSQGDAMTRGAARVVLAPTYEGDTVAQEMSFTLTCPAGDLESAWSDLLPKLRPDVWTGEPEELGMWD
ncbi:hypothetical protein AB6N23_01850 [Cellulomonas sp. 179-A 9B4 NHS]|uniref:hypothetical protein n=1 Tax=Cellulomonas sp. 179-A 9B4 NHS TaxID=3142379 RepID=UPI00399F84AB